MRIALLCATERGYRFLHKLSELAPTADFLVFSFPEEPWERPFLENIRNLTVRVGGSFHVAKHVGSKRWKTVWEDAPVDLMLAVSWRYMIPPAVYSKVRLGSYVFHDSLLPAYRGFSPTVWAMINGEDHTGVTLFEIAANVDEGPIVDQQRVPIRPEDTIATVLDHVTETYLTLLETNLPCLLNGQVRLQSQDHTGATYTCKLLPEDYCIDWNASTDSIFNLIRAVTAPYAGAYTTLRGSVVRIWGARKLAVERRYVGRIPGRIVEVRPHEGVVVLTGDGAILVTEAQVEGGPIGCATEAFGQLSHTLGR